MSTKKIIIATLIIVALIALYLFMSRDSTSNPKDGDDMVSSEEEIITVINLDENEEYISYDGGESWENELEPSFYMNLEKGIYPVDTEDIYGQLYNNSSEQYISYGHEYFLYEWDDSEFKELDFPPTMAFPDEGLGVNPGENEELKFEIHRFDLEEGRYLLEKYIRIVDSFASEDAIEYILRSEFQLE